MKDDIPLELTIKINDYYPKIGKLTYNNYNCIISCNNNQSTIPLKEIKTNNYFSENANINSDLIILLKINEHNKNLLISNSQIIIPYIKLLQLYKQKEILYERFLKFNIKRNIMNKKFDSSFSLKYIYLKITIILKLTNCNKNASAYLKIFNNINMKKYNSIKNSSAYDSTCSIGNMSNSKNKENKWRNKSLQKKKIISRNIEIPNIGKNNYSYKPPLKHKIIYKKGFAKNNYNYFNLFMTPIQKKNANTMKGTETKYEKYMSYSCYKTMNNSNENNKAQLLNCISERRIRKSPELKKESKKKTIIKNRSVKNKILNNFNNKYK